MEDLTYIKFIARGIQKDAGGLWSALELIYAGFDIKWVASGKHIVCRPMHRRGYKHGALVLSAAYALIPDNAIIRMIAPNIIISIVDVEALKAWIGKVEPDFFA